ncbi:MAG: phosphate signaling complex protein PhoU [Desulfovibrionaceae bacterium]
MNDVLHGTSGIYALRTDVLTMSALVRQVCGKVHAAVRLRDERMAEEVVRGDDAIDEMELDLDATCTSLIARTQPVARDLRFILTAVRMVLDLERIADEAVTIARQIHLLPQQLPGTLEQELDASMRLALEMLDIACSAFRAEDVSAGMAVFRRTDASVRLMMSLYGTLMEAVGRNALAGATAVPLILMVRSIDRICRRSENIVEHLCFLCEGVTVKHRARLSGGARRHAEDMLETR